MNALACIVLGWLFLTHLKQARGWGGGHEEAEREKKKSYLSHVLEMDKEKKEEEKYGCSRENSRKLLLFEESIRGHKGTFQA